MQPGHVRHCCCESINCPIDCLRVCRTEWRTMTAIKTKGKGEQEEPRYQMTCNTFHHTSTHSLTRTQCDNVHFYWKWVMQSSNYRHRHLRPPTECAWFETQQFPTTVVKWFLDQGSISIHMMDTEKWLAAFNEIASAWHFKTIGFPLHWHFQRLWFNGNLLCNARAHTDTVVAKLIFVAQVHVYVLAYGGGKDHEIR